MGIIYRYYEQEQGLEEIQARIYSEMSGRNATAEEILRRNTTRDPKTTIYALTETGEPLAYVTARDSRSQPGRTYIGYPWALPECPEEVQLEIFNRLMEYLKGRDETNHIATTIVLEEKNSKEQFPFFRKMGFVEREIFGLYTVDIMVDEVEKWDLPDEDSLTTRELEVADVDTVVDIILKDNLLSRAFPNEAAIRTYLTDRVVPEGNVLVMLDNEEIVGAGAIIKMQPDTPFVFADSERVILRFSTLKDNYRRSAKRLVYDLVMTSKSAGWADIPFEFAFTFLAQHPSLANFPEVFPNTEIIEVIMLYEQS